MFVIKILVWVLLFALLLSSSFFQNIISGVGGVVTLINGDFWAFIPTEIRVFFSMLVLAILFGLIYAFKK